MHLHWNLCGATKEEQVPVTAQSVMKTEESM